jgi:hypothetical protein
MSSSLNVTTPTDLEILITRGLQCATRVGLGSDVKTGVNQTVALWTAGMGDGLV